VSVASAWAVALIAMMAPEADEPTAGDVAAASGASEPGGQEADAASPREPADDPAGSDDAASPYGPLLPPVPPVRAPARRNATEPADDEERTVVVRTRPQPQRDRAASVVSSEDLSERLPRSVPDALRGEPGVYIQQTAHGQASPYLRGLTGQQTVMFFDGVRLNNSTFRQGPNQYFFTVNSRSIDHLEIQRGSASTRWGSDAIGGVIIASPVEPKLEASRKVAVHSHGVVRTDTADGEVGGRAQASASLWGKVAVLVGAGYRNLGQLRSGGPVLAPATGMPQNVPPLYGPDGKTQLGTGFGELTDDLRVVWQVAPGHRLSLGYYDYRQYDAPRTDKCPPPTAPQDECLTYLEQFRTLAYGVYEGTRGPAAAEHVRLTLSYQRQHEARQERRGSPSTTLLTGEDDVHTGGTALAIDTREFEVAPWATLGGRYGADLYWDRLGSKEQLTFTDVGISVARPRGQYLDGAQYVTSGVFAEAHTELLEAIRVRTGGRMAVAAAMAEGETETESAAVNEQWVTAVGNAGIAADAVPWLTFVLNVDQGFRAPNLDDLTSRQQVGPGYQYENAGLRPERSLSLEVGTLAGNRWFELEAFAFRTTIRDLIQRASRSPEECPMNEPSCVASRNRFQLVNLEGQAVVMGAEGSMRVYLPLDFEVRATISYAWGEGANPLYGRPFEPGRVPLSRIPPLNGLAEAGWRSTRYGAYVMGTVWWAREQTRLAPQDRVDARIPEGGTPGYVVLDVRGGYQLAPWVRAAVVLRNLRDSPYRHHGSSINGAGRSLVMELQFGF
jgi:outer membrane receptor protein involved in Fe transport